jgi:RNA polymerase sigma-70 factor (ECF subfamily)
MPEDPMPAAAALNPIARPSRAAPVDLVFRDLVAQHRERLYRFVLRHIGHASDAEDLAQQAFVEAARTYAAFRGESQQSTWLYGIAMNLVRHHLTRSPAARHHHVDGDEALADLAGDDAPPDVRCDHAELVRHLEADLQELMPEMREVLLLVALDDLSYEEAAAMLAVPVGTVRSRVSRARAQLRQRMQSRGAVLPF